MGGQGGQDGGQGGRGEGLGRQDGGIKVGLLAVLVVAPLVVLGLGVGVICEYGGFLCWLWGGVVLMGDRVEDEEAEEGEGGDRGGEGVRWGGECHNREGTMCFGQSVF